MDNLTKDERSEIMSRVKSRNTRPELAVRKLIWAMGIRYRLEGRDLPGKPDIVFRRLRKVIFIHGCYWHRHEGCPNTRTPKSRVNFWTQKFETNRQRDEEHYRELKAMGWQFLIIWECEIKPRKMDELSKKISEFIENKTIII